MEEAILFFTVACFVVGIPPSLLSVLILLDRRKGGGEVNPQVPIAPESGIKSNLERSWLKGTIHKLSPLSPYCIIAFIVFGIIAVVLAGMKSAEAVKKYQTLEANSYQEIAPTNLIEGRTFRSEIVSLDGNHFSYCSFYYVRFKYNGIRPFVIDNCSIYSPITFEWPKSFDACLALLDGAGIINTNKMNMNEFRRLRESPPSSE